MSIFLCDGFRGKSINAISKFEYFYFKVWAGYEGRFGCEYDSYDFPSMYGFRRVRHLHLGR